MKIIDDKILMVRTKRPHLITESIKKSKVVSQEEDVYEVAIHWGLEEAQALAKLRIKDVPSTIKRDYKWTGRLTPFAHQKETSSFLTLHKKAFCFNEQGTGKTASVIWSADYLINIGEIRRVLVLCPLSIMKSAWQVDMFKFAMHRSCSVAYGDSKTRAKIIAAGAEFVVINFDGLAVVKDEVIDDGTFDLVVVDECNAYKNMQTNRWKVLRDVCANAKWVWMLTGTPAAQSPLDAYGIAKLINPEGCPKYYGQFRDQVMYKASQFRWIPKPQAQEVVHKVLQPAIRFEKAQCLDLPEVTFVDREAPLTAQQQKYYNMLKRQMTLTADGESVTSVNAAVNLNKLLQISCIAGDTMVLSELGWKRLDTVAPTDRVWDGVEWVGHGGVVYKGHKPVTTLHGVRMTADHQVLTTEGWHTAQEVVDGEPSKRFIRAAVWIPHSHRTKGDNRGVFNSVCTLVMSVRLWAAGSKKKPVSKGKAPDTPPKLRLPSWERNTQDVVLPAVQCMGRDETTMWFPTRQRLQELRCAGDHGMRRMGELIHSFLGGYAKFVPRWVDVGQDRQQQGVQERQLPMGYGAGAMQQHPEDPPYTDPSRGDDANKCRKVLRDEERNSAREDSSVWVGSGSSIVHTGREPEAVYDIVDAGPRNRFVVKGSGNSPFIVHNCGSVYSDNKEVIEFDVSNRLQVILEVIEESSHKVLVFVPFTHTIELFREFLEKNKISCGVINGQVSVNKRSEVIKQFQELPDPHVLIIQPQAASHGLTLTAANTVIWYAPVTSVETYLQANARINRPGQKNAMTIVHIRGSEVENRLYKMLQGNITNHTKIIDLYRQEISESV
jgi:late competence protein required for DNA uptake (superfamily II DNA/RNA helicase)